MITLVAEETKNKLNNLWCFDYEFQNGDSIKEEPLMHQATELIDSILLEAHGCIPEEIAIYFDGLELYEPDAILKYKEPSMSGSLYCSSHILNRTEDHEHDVWLCSVLMDFFHEPPEEIYVAITPIVK
jgi:hypothetical protein